MELSHIFLLALTFTACVGDRLEEANNYLDNVLNNHLSQTVRNAGLEVHELPNFTHNIQNRSADGVTVNSKIMYHSGNLTGLTLASRKDCQTPVWKSSNISVECEVVFPSITVKYEARFQNLTGHHNNIHFRQNDFGIEANLANLEAFMDITSSPHVQVPALKAFYITKFGTPSIDFKIQEDFLYERLSDHFYNKLQELIRDLFDGKFKRAVAEAVGSVRFPEK